MARSFSSQKIKKRRGWRQYIIPVLLFALVLGLFFWGIADIDSATADEKLAAVERAITKSVVQCYAVEGQYPAGVSYLRDHYGLSVDEELYTVHYVFNGGNIMPDVRVMHRNFGDEFPW